MIQNRRSKPQRHVIITIAVMVFIFIQSSFAGDVSSLESNMLAAFLRSLFGDSALIRTYYLRKAAHFIEFSVLGICLLTNGFDWKVLHPEHTVSMPVIAGFAWIAGTLYAVTDELHQFFIPGRSCSFQDICIDGAAVLFGLLICAVVRSVQYALEQGGNNSKSE